VTNTILQRLNLTARPGGPIATLEDPMTVARLGTFTFATAAVSTATFSLLFFWFAEPVAGWVTLGYALVFVVVWAWYVISPRAGNAETAVMIVVVAAVVNHVVVHVSLGGYANSGAYLMFGVAVTMTSALILPRTGTVALATFYAVLAVVFGFLESTLEARRPAPDPTLSTILFVIVLVASLGILTPMFNYFLSRLAEERARAESLLLNVLPPVVATELKAKGVTTARRYDAVSVLFADIVGFTPLSASMEPEEMVTQLNEVFSYFDSLADRYGCEKIRTIGDNYMVACGVPVPREGNAEVLCRMALDMVDYAETSPLRFRIGINSGPVVAGVIGRRKFQYDIWGDTVNTASRMESQGEPGRIQITEATYDEIKDRFAATPRGVIDIKGKGPLRTWFLEAVNAEPAHSG
jgi:adenylate cyclase